MIFTHVPATFSICSNIPGHKKVIHVVSNGDTQKLVDEMVQIQLEQQASASKLMRNKFEPILSTLQARVDIFKMLHPDYDKDSLEVRNFKRMNSLLSSLQKYCDQLPVIGFNSQRYDIPLIKRYLPASLQRLDSLPHFIIRKTNSYMALATKRLKFLDMVNYLAAGTSLNSFYEAFKVQTPKGFFPYEWFDSLEKLKAPALPSQAEFYN